MSRRPLLGVVHPETGEVLTCPACQTREDVIVQLEKENRLHKAKITKLERDDNKSARNDSCWDEAQALFEWWQLACWHPRSTLSAEDFWMVKPHLQKRDGLINCLRAVCGAAFDPYITQQKNGRAKRHDGWDQIFKTKAKMERYEERVPGEEGSEQWKNWLLVRIETDLS